MTDSRRPACSVIPKAIFDWSAGTVRPGVPASGEFLARIPPRVYCPVLLRVRSRVKIRVNLIRVDGRRSRTTEPKKHRVDTVACSPLNVSDRGVRPDSRDFKNEIIFRRNRSIDHTARAYVVGILKIRFYNRPPSVSSNLNTRETLRSSLCPPGIGRNVVSGGRRPRVATTCCCVILQETERNNRTKALF